ALAEFHRVLRDGGRIAVSINTDPRRSLAGRVRLAVARHVPAMNAAIAHRYSLNDVSQMRTLLQSAGLRDVEVILETRRFHFPSFDAYFDPFEQGGGPWGAQYMALASDTRSIIRDEVRQGLRDQTGGRGSIEIEVDIIFGGGARLSLAALRCTAIGHPMHEIS